MGAKDNTPENERRMMRVVDAATLDGYRLRVTFDNGEVKTVDVGPFLSGDGSMVRPLREDDALFRAAWADGGTVIWPNGFDLDPDVLYYDDLREAAIARLSVAIAH